MTITDAINDVYLRAVGKTPLPATSTAKFTRIVGLLDFYQRQWAREKGVDWASLYNPALSIGRVTATDTFDLDTSTIRKLSNRDEDYIRIVWADKVGYTDYTLVDANKLKDYYAGANKESYMGFYAAKMGGELVFNHTFTANDGQFGGEIFVPCYVLTDEITADNPDSDEVQVDDPDWLVTRVAAEYVRNDITRRPRFVELLTEANDIMDRMKDDNDGQIDTVDMPWTPGVPSSSVRR